MRAVLDGETLCLDCWWPTHLSDAPAESEQVIDTIEQKWRELRDFAIGFEEAIASERMSHPEKIPEARHALRFHAALLLADAERLKAVLPADAERFVQRHLGQPPYPTWRDVMIEMHPEAKEMLEKAGE